MPITTGRQIAAARALLGLSDFDLMVLLDDIPHADELMEHDGGYFKALDVLFESLGVITSDDGDRVSVSVSSTAEATARRMLGRSTKPPAEVPPTNLTHRQAVVAAARMEVLLAFDEFKGARSARACMDEFIAHWHGLPVSDDGRPRLKFGIRTLTRWLAIRARGGSLATHWKGGRKAWYDKFPEVRAALIEGIASAPVVSAGCVARALKVRFPEHASLFSAGSVNRAIKALRASGDLTKVIRRAVNGRPISG